MRYAYALVGSAALVAAQNATMNATLCDKYTMALLKENSAANQKTVLTLVVNTAVIGSYPKPEIEGVTFPDVNVTGILNPGQYMGEDVNLLPYFNGGLASSSRNDMPVAINFLDGGGPTPLMNNTAADADKMDSNQYVLLTHLYSYFGTLLGCSGIGQMDFPTYAGSNSQGKVHQFMALNATQVGYFIQEVGLSASSFGVTDDDVNTVGMLLTDTFNQRCSAPAAPIMGQDAEIQAICQEESCPEAENPQCDAYMEVVEPGIANSTNAMGEGDPANTATMVATGSPTEQTGGSGTGSAPSESSSGAAAKAVAGMLAAGAAGAAAFLL